jgi:ATP-binding cassette subfamily B (MDR/TAP) protein 1
MPSLFLHFQLTGHALISRGNFWALLFFVLALFVGLSYLVIAGLGAGLGEVRMSSSPHAFSY